ncbi:hypothetical protein Q5752_004010 [Cryptotrichosporon argae]
MTMYPPNTSTQQPAAVCALKSPADAIHVLEAVRLGLVPRVTRRLTGQERQMIRPGTVWVWEEEETNMRRWTDGRRWGASRVGGGGFLVYTESSESLSPPASRHDSPAGSTPAPGYYGSGSPRRVEPLIKQTYSTTMTHPVNAKAKKFHVVAYSSKHNPQGDGPNPLPLPHELPNLARIKVQPGIWPDWESRREEYNARRQASSAPTPTPSVAPSASAGPSTPGTAHAHAHAATPAPAPVPAPYLEHRAGSPRHEPPRSYLYDRRDWREYADEARGRDRDPRERDPRPGPPRDYRDYPDYVRYPPPDRYHMSYPDPRDPRYERDGQLPPPPPPPPGAFYPPPHYHPDYYARPPPPGYPPRDGDWLDVPRGWAPRSPEREAHERRMHEQRAYEAAHGRPEPARDGRDGGRGDAHARDYEADREREPANGHAASVKAELASRSRARGTASRSRTPPSRSPTTATPSSIASSLIHPPAAGVTLPPLRVAIDDPRAGGRDRDQRDRLSPRSNDGKEGWGRVPA